MAGASFPAVETLNEFTQEEEPYLATMSSVTEPAKPAPKECSFTSQGAWFLSYRDSMATKKEQEYPSTQLLRPNIRYHRRSSDSEVASMPNLPPSPNERRKSADGIGEGGTPNLPPSPNDTASPNIRRNRRSSDSEVASMPNLPPAPPPSPPPRFERRKSACGAGEGGTPNLPPSPNERRKSADGIGIGGTLTMVDPRLLYRRSTLADLKAGNRSVEMAQAIAKEPVAGPSPLLGARRISFFENDSSLVSSDSFLDKDAERTIMGPSMLPLCPTSPRRRASWGSPPACPKDNLKPLVCDNSRRRSLDGMTRKQAEAMGHEEVWEDEAEARKADMKSIAGIIGQKGDFTYMKIKSLFLANDSDRDGKLSECEVSAFCNQLGFSEKVAAQLYEFMEKDQHGNANWQKFMVWYGPEMKNYTDLTAEPPFLSPTSSKRKKMSTSLCGRAPENDRKCQRENVDEYKLYNLK